MSASAWLILFVIVVGARVVYLVATQNQRRARNRALWRETTQGLNERHRARRGRDDSATRESPASSTCSLSSPPTLWELKCTSPATRRLRPGTYSRTPDLCVWSSSG